jgi:hypothetical protein
MAALNIIGARGLFEGKGVSASRVSPPAPLSLPHPPSLSYARTSVRSERKLVHVSRSDIRLISTFRFGSVV